MTDAERMEKLLAELDMTNVDFARYAGVALSSVQRWIKGIIKVPRNIMLLLELMCHISRGQKMIGVSWSDPANAEQDEDHAPDCPKSWGGPSMPNCTCVPRA